MCRKKVEFLKNQSKALLLPVDECDIEDVDDETSLLGHSRRQNRGLRVTNNACWNTAVVAKRGLHNRNVISNFVF